MLTIELRTPSDDGAKALGSFFISPAAIASLSAAEFSGIRGGNVAYNYATKQITKLRSQFKLIEVFQL